MVNEIPDDPTRLQIGRWAASGIVVALGGLVSIRANVLHWETDYDRLLWKSPSDDLYAQFAALWQKKPSAVLAFTRKWGPLRIDENGNEVKGINVGAEPLEWWRYLSRRAFAILRISKALERGEIGADEDWDFLTNTHRERAPRQARFGLPEHFRYDFMRTDDPNALVNLLISRTLADGSKNRITYAKATIAGEASAWLEQFDVKLGLDWDQKSAWQIKMRYGGRMLSAVALQLALTIAHGDRLFTCSGCGMPYNRAPQKRSPNSGHANFCPVCARNRKPQREAEKRYRENRRTAIKLAVSGMTAREIADRLNRTTDVVRHWLEKDR